mgnify:FL=1
MMDREEEGVLLDEKQLIEETSIFREDIFSSKTMDQEMIASSETNLKLEDASPSEILSSEKDLLAIVEGSGN